MESRELCIRCGKPTLYHPNTPIKLRRYFVEGSGQLCEKCFYELYPVPRANDGKHFINPEEAIRYGTGKE